MDARQKEQKGMEGVKLFQLRHLWKQELTIQTAIYQAQKIKLLPLALLCATVAAVHLTAGDAFAATIPAVRLTAGGAFAASVAAMRFTSGDAFVARFAVACDALTLETPRGTVTAPDFVGSVTDTRALVGFLAASEDLSGFLISIVLQGTVEVEHFLVVILDDLPERVSLPVLAFSQGNPQPPPACLSFMASFSLLLDMVSQTTESNKKF